MKATFVVASAVIVMASAWPVAAESAFFDRSGRLTSLVYSGDELMVRGRVQIPSPDGSRMGEPVAATTRGADRTSYQGVITTEPGKTARVRQTAIEEGGRIWISVDVTADVDLDVAGVYYTIDVPRTEFAGGQATVQTAAGARTAALPPLKPAERDFFRAEGSAQIGRAHVSSDLSTFPGPSPPADKPPSKRPRAHAPPRCRRSSPPSAISFAPRDLPRSEEHTSLPIYRRSQDRVRRRTSHRPNGRGRTHRRAAAAQARRARFLSRRGICPVASGRGSQPDAIRHAGRPAFDRAGGPLGPHRPNLRGHDPDTPGSPRRRADG